MLLARRIGPAPWAMLAAPLLVMALAPGCRTVRKPESAEVPVSSSEPTLLPAEAESVMGEDPQIVVKKVAEPIVVAAWAEPKSLPEGGGQAQLLVRVQKRGGAAYPGVEVRFKTSSGSLYSGGKTLTTDKLGRTRDRLTAKKAATITLNAGGTRYTFEVAVGE